MTDPCETTVLTGADGAELDLRRHGGQVVGWRPAGGAERLWLSPLAECGPGKAIRGGVPVVFPQFADRGPLPKHGFARDRAWETSTDGGTWVARLVDDAETRALWPHAFGLTLTATAQGRSCTITLEVANRGDEAFEFTAALHDYLVVGSRDATITGLGGLPGEDNAAGGATLVVPDTPLAALEPRDVAVRGVSAPVRLDDLELTMTGFDSCVVWNPGADGAPGDVPPGGTSEFVCLESAVLTPVRLAAGDHWRGTQTLQAG